MGRRAVGVAIRTVAVLAAFGLGGGASAAPGAWSAGPASSRLLVRVQKRGLLSGLAHDHEFLATDWRASAAFDPAGGAPARFEVVVRTGSLRDQQPALSAVDRAKVDEQAARTLEAARFPEVRFSADRLVLQPGAQGPEGRLEGALSGTLTLHGQERPLGVAVRAAREGAGWRATGTVRFRQRDFGVEPFSGFLGTIAVHDEVEVAFDLLLAPEG